MESILRSGLVVTLISIATACGDPPAPASGSATAAAGSANPSVGGLKEGDAAPSLTLELQDGKKIELASLKGKQVLVYFYPKDDTPGCTVEAQGIRDAWTKFQEAGIQVYGVSTQDASSHQAFIDKHTLPFPLVVDADQKVAKAFGVPVKGEYAARHSFLIGTDGKVKKIWREVKPDAHAEDVLAAAKS
jgi:peroxiredoxin Q/BCP